MISRLVSAVFSIAVMFTLAPATKADWYEASSDHFVIYADDSEKDVRRFAQNLELYHGALTLLTGRNVEKPSPSNRVTIFVVGSGRDIRRLAGDKNGDIAGFYIPRAGGSKAFVQNIRHKNGYPHFSTVVLLHEYAHHFLISSNRFAMPRWVSEGAAEFFSAATFNRDGSILIGRAAQHRAYEVADRTPLHVTTLLDPDYIRSSRDGFYGRSWLLYHYLAFSKERTGQLTKYLVGIANGMPSLQAGQEAFGDLNRLNRELNTYRRGRMMTYSLEPEAVKIGDIALRKLPEGEAEMMDLRMISQRGVNREQAEELVPEVREIAEKYPNDPGVLSALAEAEYDAGNDDAAIAAADRAIAIDPTRTNPYIQKGYALFRKARDSDDPDKAYDAAMAPFSALNSQETNHPLPLIYYYRSYVERGMAPPENARLALERAAELAPFDQGLWMQAAMMQASEGKIDLAKFHLRPLAADPHGGRTSNAAKKLIALLNTIEEGTPFRINRRESEVLAVEGEEGEEGSEEGAGEGQDSSDDEAAVAQPFAIAG